ncbi:RSP_2648 family PIN domain-containing protein [Phaeobacter sp. B1627]|uniref:RSP_2648 family PIN domain-containing protein n=1 Tax=Phaeobacter sp. B1627 TaxID=2583809 RepID=UPI0011181304|nr:PIN domain-containing protein [Phaeobacter sp. B1627]TNJ44053.1 PIN domain-containing protein [Phaeobacter sp. B1627]
MKLLLDTCVLYPTVMREMLLGAAQLGHFTPLWSERILGEWARAAVKIGPEGPAQAQAEIALLRAAWPKSDVAVKPGVAARLWLPDENDIHVLAAAVSGHADAIVTMNIKDFPRHLLAEEGLGRQGPDEVLYGLWLQDRAGIEAVGQRVLAEANRLAGNARSRKTQTGKIPSEQIWEMRPLLKKARLPRIAKALG